MSAYFQILNVHFFASLSKLALGIEDKSSLLEQHQGFAGQLLLNIPHQHVMLVAGWAGRDHSLIYYYETGGIPDWKPDLKISPLKKLLELGYKPLRYRGMAREEGPTGKEILTRAARSSALVVPEPVIGEP